MAWRVYKDSSITAVEAQDRMRASIFECLEVRTYHEINPLLTDTAAFHSKLGSDNSLTNSPMALVDLTS